MTDVMRQEYRPLTNQEKDSMSTVKQLAQILYNCIDNLGESRELSLSKTKEEEAVMWATKHLTK